MKGGEWQSYSDFKPNGDRCEDFLHIVGWGPEVLIPRGAPRKNKECEHKHFMDVVDDNDHDKIVGKACMNCNHYEEINGRQES